VPGGHEEALIHRALRAINDQDIEAIAALACIHHVASYYDPKEAMAAAGVPEPSV
jgi:hypothetical protein